MGQPDAVSVAMLDLADHLAGLDDAQWDADSLCEAWRVRDVVAHMTAGATGAFAAGAVLAGLVRHRFDYNRWIAVDGRTRGQRDPAVILREFRDAAHERRGSPPVRALAHVLIHGQDVCRPLGITRELPESHLVAVAEFTATSVIFRARRHICGVKLTASDVEWSHGSGPEVTGPAEALVMMMAGRMSALADLSGEGLDVLRHAAERR